MPLPPDHTTSGSEARKLTLECELQAVARGRGEGASILLVNPVWLTVGQAAGADQLRPSTEGRSCAPNAPHQGKGVIEGPALHLSPSI